MKETSLQLTIVIDSNLMRQDRTFSKPDLLLIKELCKLGLVKLQIPWFVYKECTTDTTASIEAEISKAISSIAGLERKGLHTDDAKAASKLAAKLEGIKKRVKSSVELVWKDFIKESKAVLHAFAEADSTPVFKDYFTGSPPFSELKDRKDIPDAFIFQTLKKIAKSRRVHFISEDANLRDKCSHIRMS